MRSTISRFILRLTAVAATFQAAHGAELSEGHLLQAGGKSVTALVYSQDGQMLASGSRDGAVSIWSYRPTRLMRTSLVHSGKVAAVAFSPNGNLLASGGQDRSLRIWTVAGKELRKLDGHTNGISALAFSPDGRTLVSGGTDGSVFLWNTKDWTLTHRLLGHPTCIHAVLVSANNEFLASGSDEFLRVWNLKDAAHSFDTLREGVRALSYHDLDVASPGDQKPKFHSSDGRGIMAWQPSGVIGTHILAPWDSHIGIIFSESKTAPSAVATESDLMATGWTNGVVEIRDANGYGKVTLTAHTTVVESVAFSPGGKGLVTGGEDGTIKLWDVGRLMDQANSDASRKRREKNER